MRKLLILILTLGVLSATAQSDIYDPSTLRTRINAEIIANNAKLITGPQLNKLLNGVLNIMPSYLNGMTYNNAYPYTVKLGGALSQHTTINGLGTYDLKFSNLRNLIFENLPTTTDTLHFKPILINSAGLVKQGPATVAGGGYTTVPPIYNFGDTILLGVVPPSLGGTGQTTIGAPYQLFRTNPAGTATEWWSANYLTRDSLLTSAGELYHFLPPIYKDAFNNVSVNYHAPIWNSDFVQDYHWEAGTPKHKQSWVFDSTVHEWKHAFIADNMIIYAELDSIALSKLITVNAGTGIIIPQTAAQNLGLPPVWTVNTDTSLIATKWYVDSKGDTNFANTDLSATGNRTHNWDTYNFLQQFSTGIWDITASHPITGDNTSLSVAQNGIFASAQNGAGTESAGINVYADMITHTQVNGRYLYYNIPVSSTPTTKVLVWDAGTQQIYYRDETDIVSGGGGGSETDPLSLHLSDTSAVFTDLRNWIGADNGLSMSFNKVIWGGSSLYQNVEINGGTDGNYYRIDFFNLDQFSAQSSFAFGDNGDGSNSQGGLISHGWNTYMWSGIQNNGSNSNIWNMKQSLYNDGSITGVAKYRLYLTNSSSSTVSEVYMDNADYHVFANGLQIKHPTTASSITARYSTISVSGNYADTSGDILIVATDYADNAAAIAGGLTAGKLYRTGDNLKVVH
jgi:hypothetical protein